MDKATYERIESYMRSCMSDSAHDTEHVYRVLYAARGIARTEHGVDEDVLDAACLLHDIGRKEQFADPALDHAEVGGDKAYAFLKSMGMTEEFADKVRRCIITHRFRKNDPPESIEAKILFDADKLDVTGAMGVARTLVYKGGVGDPLYSLGNDGKPTTGEHDAKPSFFQEYHFKLKNLYDRFYTARGKQIAASRRAAAENFYNSLYSEVMETYEMKEE